MNIVSRRSPDMKVESGTRYNITIILLRENIREFLSIFRDFNISCIGFISSQKLIQKFLLLNLTILLQIFLELLLLNRLYRFKTLTLKYSISKAQLILQLIDFLRDLKQSLMIQINNTKEILIIRLLLNQIILVFWPPLLKQIIIKTILSLSQYQKIP